MIKRFYSSGASTRKCSRFYHRSFEKFSRFQLRIRLLKDFFPRQETQSMIIAHVYQLTKSISCFFFNETNNSSYASRTKLKQQHKHGLVSNGRRTLSRIHRMCQQWKRKNTMKRISSMNCFASLTKKMMRILLNNQRKRFSFALSPTRTDLFYCYMCCFSTYFRSHRPFSWFTFLCTCSSINALM